MLIEFTLGNYLSFKQAATLSMVATPLRSADPRADAGAMTTLTPDLSVLHSAAVYGANASGKSNIFAGMRFAADFIVGSAREGQLGDGIPVLPFLLETGSRERPSLFEFVVRTGGDEVEEATYRYGFEVTRERVVSEWLYRTRRRESLLLRRDDTGLTLKGDLARAAPLGRFNRPNALFLSVAAQFADPIAAALIAWFRALRSVSGAAHDGRVTAHDHFVGTYGDRIERLIASLDVGIRALLVRETSPVEPLPNGTAESGSRRPRYHVAAKHAVFDEDGNEVEAIDFPLHTRESEGTRTLFTLAGPLFSALDFGHPLVVDELSDRLHPEASEALIRLFHDPETNPRGAQLIFATHDTSLLSRDLFRRDQIWFVEKDERGASTLYSLAAFRVSHDGPFGADYLKGRFGAVPFLGGVPGAVVRPRRDDGDAS